MSEPTTGIPAVMASSRVSPNDSRRDGTMAIRASPSVAMTSPCSSTPRYVTWAPLALSSPRPVRSPLHGWSAPATTTDNGRPARRNASARTSTPFRGSRRPKKATS